MTFNGDIIPMKSHIYNCCAERLQIDTPIRQHIMGIYVN